MLTSIRICALVSCCGLLATTIACGKKPPDNASNTAKPAGRVQGKPPAAMRARPAASPRKPPSKAKAKAPSWKPPTYARSDQVRELPFNVTFGKLVLPGTLTVPTARGGKRYPAVVLVHGSGAHDRDETIGPNKVFKDLAWGLAAQGIAVLRYDKVTKAHPGAFSARHGERYTIDHLATNAALAAADQLRKHPLVQPARVFVLGHSQGAVVMPRVGKRDPKLAGVIMLAGNARDLEDVVVAQLEYIVSLKGPQAKAVQAMLPAVKKGRDLIKSKRLKPTTPTKDLPVGIPATFWLDLRGYKPHLVAKALKMSVLVLQGQADYQVTMEDFALWKEALKDKKNARCKSYPRLGHLFIDVKKKRSVPMDILKIAGHVQKPVVDDIAVFIKSTK